MFAIDVPRLRLLHEPLTYAPLVLSQQYGAKLGEGVRPRIVERPEDALAVLNRQRHDDSAESERLPARESPSLWT